MNLADWPSLPPPPAAAAPRRRRWGAAILVVLLAAGSLSALVAATQAGKGEYVFARTRAGGSPYRWSSCATIHYVVNLDGAPPSALGDVRQAAARVAAASGTPWVYDGTSSTTVEDMVATLFQVNGSGERWLPVLVSWAPQREFDDLLNTEDPGALAFAHAEPGDGADFATYESGVVVVDAGAEIPPGFTARDSLGPVLMHEFGHIMGLGHVASGRELMWSPDAKGASGFADPGQTDWGPGDLEGLKLLGRNGAACTSASPST